MHPFIELLPPVMQVHGPVFKSIYDHHTLAAYKTGRAMIAEETKDNMGQYLNSLKTTQEEIDAAIESVDLLAKVLNDHLEKQGPQSKEPSSGDSLTRQINSEGMIQIIQGMHKELHNAARIQNELLEQMRRYHAPLAHIADVQEWRIPFFLHENLAHVTDSLSKRLEESAITIDIDCPKDIVLNLCPPKVGRIIRGLIRKCLEHFDRSPIEDPHIHLRAFQSDHICLEVEDNNQTIDREEREGLLERDHSSTHSMFLYANVLESMFNGRDKPDKTLFLEPKSSDGGNRYVVYFPTAKMPKDLLGDAS